MPETLRHLKLRVALLSIIERWLAGRGAAGSEQFVYWNARDPRRCLSPDVFVKIGASSEPFDSWKIWERGGPPDVAVEIASDSDASELRLEEKLERYHELGVRELARFDGDAAPGARLRVWDRLREDLVERRVEGDTTPCATFGLHWVVAPLAGFPCGLRLAADPGGADLLPTGEEAEARARAGEARARVEAEVAREAEARARAEAERRVAELEAELAKRR
ncbi:MAG: Uma2 family endonuclease [Deltaproteobacteria bacterium]|nr:Uma2 family endonuclease [Deltaproteobacteria bacterium]